MSEHDWELDLEDFDWRESTGVDAGEAASAEDAAFSQFFAQLDGVRASDAVRASTLEAILSDGDAPVRGASSAAGKEARKRKAPAHLRRSRRSDAPRPRRLRRAVLVACLLLVLIVVGTGSWFLPFSQVAIAQDDLSVEFGINLYGVTVTTKAEGELSKKVLSKASVDNRRVEDALVQVLDAYDELRVESDAGTGGGAMTVDVRTPGGIGDENLRRQAEGVVAGHGDKMHETLPQQQGSDVGAVEESAPQGDATRGSAPQSATPQDVAQHDAVPQDIAPQDAVPQNAAPQDAAPQGAVPQDQSFGGEAMQGPNQQEHGFERNQQQDAFGGGPSGNGPRA
ncbi:MAG: hypothetical protein IKF14_06555 [Atopobiaceae bacterium]|nr:hypothetical protein [Atopobiaceae bacterium]